MNGVLLIDKPPDWTSHDVVAKMRGLYHEKRIGHSGTLDPMATGLLVLFLGRATRAVSYAEADRKVYEAGIRFGTVTDTQDVTGRVLQSEADVSVSQQALEEVLNAFRGKISQIPPMYSAVHVQGKRLYALARKGQEVERAPRQVEIFALSLCALSGAHGVLRICCSKGTYVRTLCHDIGQRLGCGACMESLRRLSAGRFSVDAAHTIEEISALDPTERERLLLPLDDLFAELPALPLTQRQTERVYNGGSFPTKQAPGVYRVYSPDGAFLALCEVEDGVMRTQRSFFEVTT